MPNAVTVVAALLVIVVIIVIAYFALAEPAADEIVLPSDETVSLPGEAVIVPPPTAPPAGNMSPAEPSQPAAAQPVAVQQPVATQPIVIPQPVVQQPVATQPIVVLPPPSALGKYIVTRGVDLTPGKDLWALHSTTPEKCAVKCDSSQSCVGFSSKGSSCWGKSSRSGVSNSGVTAYTTNSAAVVPAPPATLQWRSKARQDITPGIDMWAFSGNVDACKAKCGADPKCKAFTINSTNSRCWGKSSSQYSTRPTSSTAWVKL